ncbi:MAG: hypothetical protein KC431_16270, partial [Myxococcales bacterium]|nr:hypothetical protein [Myxococcales bacterium]
MLLQATSPRRLGATVRALCAGVEPWDPACALQVCLRAEELEQVPDESRVLLRVRPDDAAWLNLRRPLVAEKKLRLVLWADEPAMAALVREAVDFYDWISREVSVPAAALPEELLADLRAALEADLPLQWQGPGLDDCLQALGVGATVETRAHGHFIELLEQLKAPGLVVVDG